MGRESSELSSVADDVQIDLPADGPGLVDGGLYSSEEQLITPSILAKTYW